MASATGSPLNASDTQSRCLIVCCDGTGNIWGNGHDTNVVKIARLLVKDDQQLLYYDPGVGTTDNFPPIDFSSRIHAYAHRFVGLAFAGGIYEDVAGGYEFLVNNYRAGDRICLFGFSRGAFTVRSIAGIVDEFGLVRPAAQAIVPILVRAYFLPSDRSTGSSGKTRSALAEDIQTNFCSPAGAAATIYFLGVWDTVESVGLGGLRITTDTNVRQKRYHHVRHAVALNEQRWKYSPRLYTSDGEPVCPGQTFRQVWFTGCHSDIGGSYADASLSNLTLRWMIDQAQDPAVGLRFADAARLVSGNPNGLAHDEAFISPWWTLVELCHRYRPADAEMHPAVLHRHDNRTVWTAFWRRPLFWLLLVVTGVLGALPGIVLAWHSPDFWPRLKLGLGFQIFPWRYLQDPLEFTTSAARCATCLDFILIPAYVSLLALLIVHARHHLSYSPQNRVAARLDRLLSAWPLVLLALFDLAEDVAVLAGLGSCDPSTWASVVKVLTGAKLAGVAFLTAYLLVVAWLSRPPKAAIPQVRVPNA